MRGFRDNEVLLQAGYDVIVISPQRALHAIFQDRFWRSDRDFPIAFYSNFFVTMHGFRDNEVLLQTGYDVMVISPLGGDSGDFDGGFWKSDYDFLLVVNGNFCPNSNGLEVNRHFLYAWDFPTGSKILGVLGENDPQKVKISKIICLKGTFLSQFTSFELLCIKIGSRTGIGCMRVNIKQK